MAKAKTQPPADFGEWVEVMREIANGSDRVVAIVMTAMVNDVLTLALVHSLKQDARVQRLFEPGQAAGSFGTQITLAFGLGLIGENARNDLDVIRGIRNDFAHDSLAPSGKGKRATPDFTSGSIADRLKNLRYPDLNPPFQFDPAKPQEPDKILPPLQGKARFEQTCRALRGRLQEVAADASKREQLHY